MKESVCISLLTYDSFFLKQWKRAETDLSFPVTETIVTLPAYPNENKRYLTKNIGKIAKCNIQRIPNESIDATPYTCIDPREGKKSFLILEIELLVFQF
jgi:molecular chaperone HscC